MPVVTFQRQDLCALIGQDVPMDVLSERMPMIGGDLERVEEDAITIEWFPDRPDLLTPEGTARAVAAFLGLRTGTRAYEVARPTTTLHVDAAVQEVRPHAALCYVRGVPFDEAYVKAVVEAQEKLTLSPGRRRRKIAIGVHDASGMEGPFTYTAVARDGLRFVPLQSTQPMTPGEILEDHPKGQEYAHLVGDHVPVFLDGAGEVISMPPVINAARTAVSATTKDVLIDVTGTDAAAVRRTAALLATGFADRGGRIEAVEVHDASGTWACPDLRPSERRLHTDDVQRLLGRAFTGDEAAAALACMGHGAEAYENQVLVRTPAWRADILHDVDLMEDIAIGFGYERFEGALPEQVTFGRTLPIHNVEQKARSLMLGLGFSEARTLTLSNAQDQFGRWNAPEGEAVQVANAVLEEQTHLRVRLAPSLLRVLAANLHRPLPQRLFEAGYVVLPEQGGWRNRLWLGAVECSAKAGFSDVKGLAEALVRDLGLDAHLRPADLPGLIPGRGGTMHLGDLEIGRFGELHPDTVLAFGLVAPCTVLELDLEALPGEVR